MTKRAGFGFAGHPCCNTLGSEPCMQEATVRSGELSVADRKDCSPPVTEHRLFNSRVVVIVCVKFGQFKHCQRPPCILARYSRDPSPTQTRGPQMSYSVRVPLLKYMHTVKCVVGCREVDACAGRGKRWKGAAVLPGCAGRSRQGGHAGVTSTFLILSV